MPKKILVLHTGGTISMQADASGAVVTSSDNPMNHVSNPLEGIQVHALDFLIYQALISNPNICWLSTKKSKRKQITTMGW